VKSVLCAGAVRGAVSLLRGSSNEPLFVVETLEAGGRYKVFAAAVNSSGNEGPHSEVVVAEVRASAAA
jgi:hypothetical protein